jgi:hypothetical protein
VFDQHKTSKELKKGAADVDRTFKVSSESFLIYNLNLKKEGKLKLKTFPCKRHSL